MLELIRDYFFFLRVHRKLWMLPILAALIFLALLLTVSKMSVAAPLIYTVF